MKFTTPILFLVSTFLTLTAVQADVSPANVASAKSKIEQAITILKSVGADTTAAQLVADKANSFMNQGNSSGSNDNNDLNANGGRGGNSNTGFGTTDGGFTQPAQQEEKMMMKENDNNNSDNNPSNNNVFGNVDKDFGRDGNGQTSSSGVEQSSDKTNIFGNVDKDFGRINASASNCNAKDLQLIISGDLVVFGVDDIPVSKNPIIPVQRICTPIEDDACRKICSEACAALRETRVRGGKKADVRAMGAAVDGFNAMMGKKTQYSVTPLEI
ncbi:hypothetical protein HDU97_003823 [Phlyctochytrium planicorne]|nr:hypothetical protein HDU97_003823 [Phlyctochytrium planicorne]